MNQVQSQSVDSLVSSCVLSRCRKCVPSPACTSRASTQSKESVEAPHQQTAIHLSRKQQLQSASITDNLLCRILLQHSGTKSRCHYEELRPYLLSQNEGMTQRPSLQLYQMEPMNGCHTHASEWRVQAGEFIENTLRSRKFSNYIR